MFVLQNYLWTDFEDLQMDVWVKNEQEDVQEDVQDLGDIKDTLYVDTWVKEEQEDNNEESQQTLPLGGKRRHSTESSHGCILEADRPSEDSKELSWVDTEPVDKKIKLDEVGTTVVVKDEDDHHCLTDDGRCVEHRCNNCCDNFDSASDLVDHLKYCFARIPSKCSGVTCSTATALSNCLTLHDIGSQVDANTGKSIPEPQY